MNWLQQQLQNTPPPDTILHLGAGLCRELPHWLEAGASRIVLVEPNPEMLAELRVRAQDHDSVEIISAAIAGQSGRDFLRLFNFPMLSSLRKPTGLYDSLPGLYEAGRVSVDLLTIDQLLKQLVLAEKTNNWLIIDAPGEEGAIIDGLKRSDQLQYFSRIFLSVGTALLYEGAKIASDLLTLLKEYGFESLGSPDHSDGDWPRFHLYLDRMALECNRLRAEVIQQEKLVRQQNADLEVKTQELLKLEQGANEKQRLLEEEKSRQHNLEKKLRAEISDLTQMVEDCESSLKDEQSKRVTAEESLAELEDAYARARNELSEALRRVEGLHKKLDHLLGEFSKIDGLQKSLHNLKDSISGTIDSSLSRTACQIEATVRLSSYLGTGDLMPGYGDWAICPDFAIFLAEQIEHENPDLIIEFGSGSSTVLMARSVDRRNRRYGLPPLPSDQARIGSRDEPGTPTRTLVPRDLLKPIVSFEHSRKYLHQTRALLEMNDVQDIVDLVHAPLVDFRHNENDFAFYQCDEELARIEKVLTKDSSRILVLVDGPPGVTCPNARYPGLVKILKYFSSHHVDLYLDDYGRAEEKEIAERWRAILEQRGFEFSFEALPFTREVLRVSFQ